ncbi:MAG: cation-translocating P-type ATPase C-terminal domain-containing protein [Sulfurimonas sp.]|nr:cation-translocating P-type ATPase C-terminal domain-containing protein [Sulfurimonas sp.]
MNLVTDGMTAIALGVEPAEKGIMKRQPRDVNKPILDRYGIIMVAILGSYIGLGRLEYYYIGSITNIYNDRDLQVD